MMRKTLWAIGGVTLQLVVASCATLRPGVAVETFGTVDPGRDKGLSEQATAAKEVPQDVIVTQGEIPEGLDVVEEGTKLMVLPGFESRYKILGMVESDYMIASKGAVWKNVYWTWTDYEEGWRKGLCIWQAPFKLLTLGVWTMVLPWAYPCIKSAPKEESDRTIALVDGLKKGAAAMGGNRVVIVGKGDLMVITGNQYGVSTQHIKTTKIRAFILMENASEAVAAEESTNPDVPTEAADE